MLIVQGGRGYQAAVAEDLAGWKAGIADWLTSALLGAPGITSANRS